jgi:hypothetical protein
MKLQLYILLCIRSKFFENKMLRKIFKPKGMGITRRKGEKLHIEVVYNSNLYKILLG